MPLPPASSRARPLPPVDLLLVLLLLVAPSRQQTCYYPTGDEVLDGELGPAVPCPGVDQCCQQGDECFTGGMCFSAQAGQLYRGFCTDSSWSSSSCPSTCQSGGSGWMWVNECGAGNVCCAGSDTSVDCCDSSFSWNFSPIEGSDATTVAGTETALTTVTMVETVSSTDTLVSYATSKVDEGDNGAGSSTPAVLTVTASAAQSGASAGGCEAGSLCGLLKGLGTMLLLWL